MRNQGYLLYDSDEYLDNIKLFIQNKKITWRDKNKGVCASPTLYFAILPNGEFAPCCDHRLSNFYPIYDEKFIDFYKDIEWRSEVKKITSNCEGCMYGSYPEMSISMRFMYAKIQRIKTFLLSPPEKPWPISYEKLIEIAKETKEKYKNI